jgi:AraC-like DNA-binding protein
MDYRVKNVMALMKEYLHRGWPASKLAQFVNISPSRLHQLFKHEVGLPPAKYLHLLRMERAKDLLEASYLSVKEVMAQVGLTDESHFVRDFKRSYGHTPAKYRERFQNRHHNNETQDEPDGSSPVHIPVRSSHVLKQLSHASSVSGASRNIASPLLLRRPSHPRHLVQDEAPLLRAKKKRELLSLIYLRHLAFARLTTTITDNLARGLLKVRTIFYRPRRSGVSRRLPPTLQLVLPSTIRRNSYPKAFQRRPGKSANKL